MCVIYQHACISQYMCVWWAACQWMCLHNRSYYQVTRLEAIEPGCKGLCVWQGKAGLDDWIDVDCGEFVNWEFVNWIQPVCQADSLLPIGLPEERQHQIPRRSSFLGPNRWPWITAIPVEECVPNKSVWSLWPQILRVCWEVLTMIVLIESR